MRYKNESNPKTSETSYIKLLPIIIALALVPLIVRLKIIEIPTNSLAWYTTETTSLGDLFVYYKSHLIVIAAIIAIIILAYRALNNKFKFNNYKSFYLLYGYIALVICSLLFTTNLFFSTTGYIEHYENIFVLISYVLIFIYTAVLVKTEQEFKTVIYFWIGSILILFLIGLTQYTGHDIVLSDFGKQLILPAKFAKDPDILSSSLYSDTLVYQTLYHYNYVSFYTTIGFPFFTVLFLLDTKKSHRLVSMGIMIIMIFNLIGSSSRNGFVGIGISLLIIIIFLRRAILQHWKSVLVVITISTAILIGVNSANNNVIFQKFSTLFTERNETINYPLNNIFTYKDKAVIDHDDFYMEIHNGAKNPAAPFSFYDKNGDLIEYKRVDKVYRFARNGELLEKYKNVFFKFSKYKDNPVAKMTIDGVKWNLCYANDTFSYINPYGKIEQLVEVPAIGFKGKERYGTERGYIWSRSLPLLKKYWLFGSGPDTFATVFPQNDYVGKYNAYGTQNMIVDKPHNFLLDYAINTGVLSLLVLLIFWGIYIIWSFKLYFKSNFQSFYAKIGMAAFPAVIGYLVSGLFNDTNTNITPVFWVVLGIGFAANLQYSQET